MKFQKTDIQDLILITAEPYSDSRGVFRRSYCRREYDEAGLNPEIAQTNISENFKPYTLRGFHYQKEPYGEDKTLTVIAGALFNVVIDLRRNSKSYLKSASFSLSALDRSSLFVPKGCANAFLTLEKNTTVLYYMTQEYHESSGAGIRFDDPFFNIDWPHKPEVISEKDASYVDFRPEGD